MGEIHRYVTGFQFINRLVRRPTTDRKVLQWCVIWVVVLCVGALTACGLGGYIIYRIFGGPVYTELDVSFPGEPGWTKTKEVYDGSYYIWKRTGQVRLDTADPTAFVVYFDEWMTQQGWTRNTHEGLLCDNLVETQTLSQITEGYPDQGGYIEYFPPDYAPHHKKRGCLVIWSEEGMLSVTLATFVPDWNTAVD